MTKIINHDRTTRHVELIDNGRVIDERPTTTDNAPFILALLSFQKRPEHSIALRAWRAAELVESGHVEFLERIDHNIAIITSQDNARQYYIFELDPAEPGSHQHINHRLACTCEDYRRQNSPVINGQPMCKHIMAVSMQDHINKHDVLTDWLTSLPKRPALEPGEIADEIARRDANYKTSIHGKRKRQVFDLMNKIGTQEAAEIMRRYADQPQPF
jgi:hypothetical protein